ncbi:glycoside hydrolase domain-containing protein, partial [Streptomyces sp. NPDC059744]|uniref:glycoside hydrolase domain-containing protein n=1 Tax=Streptomyces sp. NPDC059744 TaxID=3346929 RepID=UPI0036670AFB
MGEQGHPELECGLGSWDSDMYGNHRILVRAPSGGPVFGAELPWRRRDPDPSAVDVIVLAPSGRRVRNTVPIEVTAGHGRIAFEPMEGEGDYAVHYLPYAHTGRPYYPQAAYRQPTPTADPGWVHRCGLHRPERVWATLPRAEAFRYEAVSAVDSFAPMGFAATAGECAALTSAHPDEPFLLFGEDRDRPLGRYDGLPARWADAVPFAPFSGSAARGEFYVLHTGV